MRRQAPSKAKNAVVGCVLLLCLGTIGVWRYFRPKILIATKAEILTALPADLRQGEKTDLQGLIRMKRLAATARVLTQTYDAGIARRLSAKKSTDGAAGNFWIEQKESIDNIKRLLDEGPLQCAPTTDIMANDGELASIKSFARTLTNIGISLAQDGDFTAAADAIAIEQKLSRRMEGAGGGFVPYAVTVALISSTENAIQQVARTPGCPVGLCRQWLNQLPADNGADNLLQKAIRDDFQSRVLPRLSEPAQVMRDLIRTGYYAGGFFRSEPDPEEYEGVGTYDPIATAKSISRVAELKASNAARPFSRYSRLPDDLIVNQAAGLPDIIGRRKSFERVRFRLAMNREPNSIGRSMVLLYSQVGSKGSIELSCHWRTMSACTRTLLACTLFRADHGGKLPASLSELVPMYLKSVPIDCYCGKPLSYDASRRIVWSVGPDLIDDGGKILETPMLNRDVGLYLGPNDKKSVRTSMFGSYNNDVRGTSVEIRRIDAAVR